MPDLPLVRVLISSGDFVRPHYNCNGQRSTRAVSFQ
nr:MAG TPA: hypothetical protein [Caudoviricetes sp.]